MKRILLSLLICSALFTQAQVYNNEWIDYSKTYYKFNVGATGLYRISQATLNAVGLGATPAENFQLWRNGQEIPLYTSIPSGPLGGTDYIEFWGEMNDGKPDKQLYRDPDYQLNDHWSLQTDTAAYFLTVNASGANKRLINTTNDIAGNTLSPEPYFLYTLGNYFRNRLNAGNAALVQGTYVYSSAYDMGEGWTSSDIVTRDTSNINSKPVIYKAKLGNLHVYTSGPDPTFKINAAGNAINQRTFRVQINSTTILQQTMDYFSYTHAQSSFSLPLITSGNDSLFIINESTASLDRMVVAQYEINYPRLFDFDNLKSFSFELPANIAGNYLEISNFNYGATAPVLYDITNGRRYVADISNPALIKIALQPSATNRKLILVSEDPGNVSSVTALQQRSFTNYGASSNQGDYLIISNSLLYNGSNGSNPVDDYRAYRSSPTGGGYNARVYDIDQLVDQFAFGIKKHPSSVKNFIYYALNTFSSPPKFAFLIGKGVNYVQYRTYENYPDPTTQQNLEKLDLVPTFGSPASDNLLSCFQGNNIPTVPVGRLSVVYPDEISTYLKKVQEYESVQASSSPYIADKGWMKNIAHVVGADNGALQTILDQLMVNYANIISDTLFGGNVSQFSKTTTDPVQQLSSERLKSLMQEGLSIILYFGHSSASTLEFNLDDPTAYNNQGKYPVFIALGCNAGNLYNFDQTRFLTKPTISENFVLAPDRGSVAFLATTSLGIVQYLDIFNVNNYKALGVTKYGRSLGEIMDEAIKRSFDITTQFDFYARVHCEQISLNGDPALKYNTHTKPDYAIEDPLVKISPSPVSTSQGTFKVNAAVMNLGKAIDKPVVIEIKRTYPNNVTQVIKRDTVPGIRYMDSVLLDVPIVANRDKGLNKITITVDPDNTIDELYESNNSITKDVFIYDDDARPIYPYDFAIVNHQNIKLAASTANPFAPLQQYTIELDTTELFNSPFKITKTISTTGGVMEYTPAVTYVDGTVYYWRVAPVPSSGQPKWNSASFVYLANSDPGFNQSHLYQHLKSDAKKISLDSTTRKWAFDSLTNNLLIRNAIFPNAATQQADFTISVNDAAIIGGGCNYQSIAINVFDARSFKPMANDYTGGQGLYQSLYSACHPGTQYNFEYFYSDSASRRKAYNFLQNVVPDGSFVVIRANVYPTDAGNVYPSTWQAEDVPQYGAGNTLYDLLVNSGFTLLDSFNRSRCWNFVYKKNDAAHFQPQFIFSAGNYDKIILNVNCTTPDSIGYITSPVFGPAKEWKQLKWNGTSEDTTMGDNPTVDIYGVDTSGNETLIFSDLNTSMQDFDISTDINANVYPYVQLRMKNLDPVNFTPYQLNYWRLTYVPVPEGAIAPNIAFQMADTVELSQPLKFKIAFKNVSEVPFDSLKVKMIFTDRNNITNPIPISRQKPLPPDSVLIIDTTINTSNLAGLNNLYINVNPDHDQPEQYLFNNFAFRNFYVQPDSLHPVMDVTFDGAHILNRDIVSSKPHILIKLKDDAKWLVLSDTSVLTLKVRFPDGSLHPYYFNSDTLRFTPAAPAPNTNNTASVDFLPNFLKDGDYELIVTGKDMSNNQAGSIEYRVAFQVINKPMISNMLNYPNPFTTSTAFVFTLTGSEVPQNIKIEIMTITGKIVREITKDELGPLRIGRNITEFKWDGTDQYGQKLGNGIYLYRVVTNLNGKSLDKYKAADDNTDKYFNKGYGKMYLMR